MRQTTWFLALEKSTNFPWTTWASECTVRFRGPAPRASVSLCCSDTSWVLVVRMLLTTSPLEPSCMPLLTAWTVPTPFLTRMQLMFTHQISAKQPSSKRPLLPKQVHCPQHRLLHSLPNHPYSFTAFKYLFRLSFVPNGAKRGWLKTI